MNDSEGENINLLVISDYRSFHTARPEAEIFLGLAKRGYSISVITFDRGAYPEIFRKHGIKVIDAHPKKKFDSSESDFIRKYIIDYRIDIVQVYNSRAIHNARRAVTGLNVKLCLYRGTVANIHWYDPSVYLKHLHPRVDKIICNSSGVEEMFRRQPFFKKSKAITINKGHDLRWYEDVQAVDLRQEMSLPEDSFICISVANNRKVKGIPYLLKAMHLLPDSFPVYLLLVGRDMDNRSNMELIERYELNDRVILPGYQPDVLGLVKGADVFVLASTHGESITKSVIESMSVGTPAIITDIPGNRELCQHNVSGIKVPARDSVALMKAIVRCYQQPKWLSSLSEKATQHIDKHLNTKNTIEQYDQVYRSLLS